MRTGKQFVRPVNVRCAVRPVNVKDPKDTFAPRFPPKESGPFRQTNDNNNNASYSSEEAITSEATQCDTPRSDAAHVDVRYWSNSPHSWSHKSS